jgi:hypothetical protein
MSMKDTMNRNNGGKAPLILDCCLIQVNRQLHALAAFPQGNKSSAHWIGGWVGPRAGLDAAEKIKISCSCRESNPDYSVV